MKQSPWDTLRSVGYSPRKNGTVLIIRTWRAFVLGVLAHSGLSQTRSWILVRAELVVQETSPPDVMCCRYNDAYGSPIGQALGLGWVSELVARLTHTPIEVHNTTTNATMHDSIRFPLDQSIYVDSTHEVGGFVWLTAPH
jgi:hypothetical protein